MSELKPCPFCGAPAKLNKRETSECYASVLCSNILCTNDQPYPNEEMAIEHWNTRAEQPNPDEALKLPEGWKIWYAEIAVSRLNSWHSITSSHPTIAAALAEVRRRIAEVEGEK
jgi:Restriction alleviation protein Lar